MKLLSRITANALGTHHHEFAVSEREVIQAIPAILDHLSEPVGDSSIIPTSLLSEFARQHVTVALSGDGGDELFGGYWRYLGHDAVAFYQRIPKLIRRFVLEPILNSARSSRSTGGSNRVRQWRKLIQGADGDAMRRHMAWSRILQSNHGFDLMDRSLTEACMGDFLERAHARTSAMNGHDPLNQILAFDLQHQLPADMLQKVDLASMMHSLEVRVPFLDPTVVEYAVSLPSYFKIHRGRRKRILVDAYRGILPDAILDRSKKGFEVPIGEYLRGPLRTMFEDVVTRDAVESFGILSFEAVRRIYEQHFDRRADHADVLFALLSLCWWNKRRRSVVRPTSSIPRAPRITDTSMLRG